MVSSAVKLFKVSQGVKPESYREEAHFGKCILPEFLFSMVIKTNNYLRSSTDIAEKLRNKLSSL